MTSSTPAIARAPRNASRDSPSKGSMVGSIDTPIGRLWLARDEAGLREVSFAGMPGASSDDALLVEAGSQMRAYFAAELRRLEFPLSPSGTDFQRRVSAAVGEAAYGSSASYSELSACIGSA